MNPFKDISFREPEPPQRYSFETTLTTNAHIHRLADDHGCTVASFSFDSYDDMRPPPDRAVVLEACRAIVSVITAAYTINDYGTEDDRL